MIENEIVSIISNVGFPIFVTLYLMFRMERVIKTNTEAINKVIDVAKYNMRTIKSMRYGN